MDTCYNTGGRLEESEVCVFKYDMGIDERKRQSEAYYYWIEDAFDWE